jgi:hypothetical protein
MGWIRSRSHERAGRSRPAYSLEMYRRFHRRAVDGT